MSEIQVNATGHLTRDPELAYIPNGQGVAKFQLAVTPRKRDPEKGWVDGETTYLACEVWGDLGEHVAASLTRGSQAFVQGVLRTQRWKDAQGNDRERIFVRVDEIGPSLRFATAKPLKAERQSSTPGAPVSPEDDPWADARRKFHDRQSSPSGTSDPY